MSVVALPTFAATDTSTRPLRTLAGLETLRLAAHPVFLVGLVPFVYYLVREVQTAGFGIDWPLVPGFWLGLTGLIAVNRMVRSTERSGDVVVSSPASEPLRTAAVCLACLLPAALAALAAVVVFVAWQQGPATDDVLLTEYSAVELASIQAGGVLAALGGPLLGVTIARWWRWPAAAPVVAIGLVTWSVFSQLFATNVWWTLHHMAAPFNLQGGAEASSEWLQPGSLQWRVPYLVGLCALAAMTALLHGAQGSGRRRLIRGLYVVGALTLVMLVVSATTGREGYYV